MVKTYTIESVDHRARMSEHEDGHWVAKPDYDALAASVDRLTSDKARLAAELAAEQESNTFLNNLHTVDAERIRALEAALRKIGYEPIGHAEATEREVLQAIVDIARSALETEGKHGT